MYKSPLRYRARLLIRRSYQPARHLPLRPSTRVRVASRVRPSTLNPACAPEGVLALFDST